MADLEKILGGAYSLYLLPIAILFMLQWLQIFRRGSMHLARVGGALAPADLVLDPPLVSALHPSCPSQVRSSEG